MSSSKRSQGPSSDSPILPSMIVFDLDDCLWTPEMHGEYHSTTGDYLELQERKRNVDEFNKLLYRPYPLTNCSTAKRFIMGEELPGMPEIPVHGDLDPAGTQQGVIGLKVARYSDTVTLYPGARRVLYELATNPKYKGITLATASSSLEPSYSYACLDGIEILPNVTMGDMMSHNQIGRTGRLSPDKVDHFQLLHEESGIPHKEMLFFDDCNWGDHCSRVSARYGVVSQQTPYGLQWEEFVQAMAKFDKEARKNNQ